MRNCRTISAALIAVCSGLCAPVFAGAGTDASTIEARLASNDFEKRQQATNEIRSDVAISDVDLLQLCIETEIPEVRRRALAIHRARFFEAPRPAIGVRFVERSVLPMIDHIYDDFPAGTDGSLQNGDIIVGVAGQRLPLVPTLAVQELRPLIFSHNPYETVRLTVYRPRDAAVAAALLAKAQEARGLSLDGVTLAECPDGFEIVETDVKLGEWAMLDTNAPMSPIDRQRAWDALLSRMNFNPLDDALVARDASPPRNVGFHGRVVQSLDIRFPFLARGAFFPAEENPAGFRNQAVIAKQLRNIQIQRIGVRPDDVVNGRPAREIKVETVRVMGEAQARPDAERLAEIARRIASSQARILELSGRVTDAGTPAAERRAAEEEIASLRDRLAELRQELAPDDGTTKPIN
ncbi:MAG: hypothetical protein ABL309_05795 [Phycisphaerales bacterium]